MGRENSVARHYFRRSLGATDLWRLADFGGSIASINARRTPKQKPRAFAGARLLRPKTGA